MKKVFLTFLLITFVYFGPVFKGFLPLPTDLLVGAYYPWLDYKWGTITGVPVRNPSLSDVIAAQYPWRDLAIDLIKSGEWPLWNPYSFSGTPLLANWQSAPIYPLNLLMIIFPKPLGWTILLFLQPLFSMVFMFLFLKNIGLANSASVFGGVAFAFSGFMVTYLEYATIGQVFMWLPLILLFIDKYKESDNLRWLILIPLINFMMITAGSFQAVFYAFIIWVGYFLVRNGPRFGRNLLRLGIVLFVTILVTAIQLLPTIELFKLSIRNEDKNIELYNYGLLPVKNMITFLAPDFFGHASTYNFWGVMGYQESSGYFGVISIVMILSLFLIKRVQKSNIFYFWALLFVIPLIFVFNTSVGRFPFEISLPILATSYATRLFLIVNFAGSVLAAWMFNQIAKNKIGVAKVALSIAVIIIALEVFIWFQLLPTADPQVAVNLKVGMKNLIVPLVIISSFFMTLIVLRQRSMKLMLWILVGISIADMIRFGKKFNAFSPSLYLYPTTPAIEFMQQTAGEFRVDREKSEIMPPNTWIPYRLRSPSGYDPLYTRSYSFFYNLYNLVDPNQIVGRYAELENYNSPFTDLAGVKYLLAAKRDEKGLISTIGDRLSYKISEAKYKRVFEDNSVVVLENTTVLPRANLFGRFEVEKEYELAFHKLYNGFDFRNKVLLDEEPDVKVFDNSVGDGVKIISDEASEVILHTESKNGGVLMLADSFYPGWKAEVNGEAKKIYLADGIYRSVIIPPGFSKVRFFYDPISFKLGLYLTIVGLSAVLLLLVGYRPQKKAVKL